MLRLCFCDSLGLWGFLHGQHADVLLRDLVDLSAEEQCLTPRCQCQARQKSRGRALVHRMVNGRRMKLPVWADTVIDTSPGSYWLPRYTKRTTDARSLHSQEGLFRVHLYQCQTSRLVPVRPGGLGFTEICACQKTCSGAVPWGEGGVAGHTWIMYRILYTSFYKIIHCVL